VVEVRIDSGIRVPAGGIVVDLDPSEGAPAATVNGLAVTRDARGRVPVREVPATVRM
jgi:hypothetical protein